MDIGTGILLSSAVITSGGVLFRIANGRKRQTPPADEAPHIHKDLETHINGVNQRIDDLRSHVDQGFELLAGEIRSIKD